ncbi:CapA family protein [Methanosarcina sp. KYL-1]|uniref:CapA family protein n=1 Tax=Methanosarcina sp. KYL-1 TaxID=2602068 RepID=UPI0021015820|nr:CapA family protein [Methanosarcina sp. KYL-1]MCQ1535184.1 CapA family protein [Methanosarcina sp. KYL-1]
MKIIFTGDISVSGIFKKNVENFQPIVDKNISDIFVSADYVHVNLEGPITESVACDEKKTSLKAPIKTTETLKKYNVKICDLANNHIMDSGYAGLLDTIDSLKEKNIQFYGIGGYEEYLILKKDNLKVVLIASSHREGPSWDGKSPAPFLLNIKEIKNMVQQIKKKESPDYIIYNYHGGTEYNIVPEPKRRKFFKKLINIGVDIVIGHHAHVPQGIEKMGNKTIVYGLGNFCFDIDAHANKAYTQESYFIEMDLKKSDYKIEKHFYYIDKSEGVIKKSLTNQYLNFFDTKLQVFDSFLNYWFNWTQEGRRVYLNNNYDSIAYKDKKVNKQSYSLLEGTNFKKYSLVKKIYIITKKISSDLAKENKRSLVISTILWEIIHMNRNIISILRNYKNK